MSEYTLQSQFTFILKETNCQDRWTQNCRFRSRLPLRPLPPLSPLSPWPRILHFSCLWQKPSAEGWASGGNMSPLEPPAGQGKLHRPWDDINIR